MIKNTNGFLEAYYNDCKSGKEVVGLELMMMLSKLMSDMNEDEYIYDTKDADTRISFIENVLRLTKSPFYNQPMKLLPFQKAFISALYGFKMKDGTDRFQRALFLIARKNGKALDLDTRVPTPLGDRTIRDINVGDYVFDENGQPTKVLGVSETFYNHDCYRVTFEDGEEIVADANHKWAIQTKNTRRLLEYTPTSNKKRSRYDKIDKFGCITLTTKDMVDDFVRERRDGTGVEYKYRVPMSKPLDYPKKELFNPYILGLWLGDGSSEDNRLTVGRDDLEQCFKLLEEQNCKYFPRVYKGKREVRLGEQISRHNEVRDSLKKMGVWKNKHIPNEYFTASISQRLDLLQGLMDTDGTVNKGGECEFVQKNERLSKDFSKLLSSLGIKHTIALRPAKCNGKDCGLVYRIMFFVDKSFPCFKYERKKQRLKDKLSDRMKFKSIINIEKVDSVPTKCICVDNPRGLFVCGERNTVTHNSELCSALLLTDMIIGGTGRDIVCSSNDDNQASILYDACDTMRLMIDPDSMDTWRNQRHIKCLLNNNKIFKLSDRTRNREGRNIDIAVIDEIHEMSQNLVIKAIEQSQSLKPNPKLILITTEGFVNDGTLDNELIRARGILKGEIEDLASERYLIWLYTQDSEQEVWNGNRYNRLWQKSNPTLGTVKQWSYLEQQVDLAKSSKADRAFVFAKDFNIKQSNSQAWLMLEDYNYECVYDLEDFRGALCVGGVDIAETTDLSCAKILLMKPNDPKKYIYTKYFIPEGKLERADDKSAGAKYIEWANKGLVKICAGNYTDPTIIADWFADLYKDYGIRLLKCGYDIKFATDFLKRMDEYGFDTEIVYQRPEILNQSIKMVEADLKSRLINYNNNEVDRWCFSNVALKVDSQGNGLLVKIDGQHSRKIDGSVALVIVYEIFRRYMTDFKNNLQVR